MYIGIDNEYRIVLVLVVKLLYTRVLLLFCVISLTKWQQKQKKNEKEKALTVI